MKRFVSVVVVVAVAGLGGIAGAQAPGQNEPTVAAFLERRVPEELAAEGVVLSRRNLGLQIEQLADRWLVSLVDLTTARVVASTKVDALPADREAAVAAMTHVVSQLVAQVIGRAEPAPPPPPEAAQPRPAIEDLLREQRAEREERARREQRAAAELAFQRGSIRFTESYQLTDKVQDGERRRWTAYRGDPDETLDPLMFYQEVGRPDLADAYVSRKHLMVGGFVLGGAALTVALFTYGSEHSKQFDCDVAGPPSFTLTCGQPDYTLPVVALGIGVVSMGAGIYYAKNRQPISEDEARVLADGYNQRLRGRTSIPAAMRARIRDVQLVPYASGRGTGLILGARF